MSENRTAVLQAASILYAALTARHPDRVFVRASGRAAVDAKIEAELKRQVDETKARLELFQKSVAFRMALDAILPGWVDLDLDDLGIMSTEAFVSNDQGEWVAWLVTHGFDEARASEIVTEAFNDRRPL